MLDLRPVLILALLAMLITTPAASRDKQSSQPRTCDNTCLPKMRESTPTCKDSKYAQHPIACSIACECQVSKASRFCKDECAYDCKGDWPPALSVGDHET